MTIDWSKAPKGTTHFNPKEPGNPWRKVEGTTAYSQGRLYGEWLEILGPIFKNYIPRPATGPLRAEELRGGMADIDNRAVNELASAMRERLAECRTAGKSGWDDPEQCPPQRLADGLVRAVRKGDLIDVANYAAMLLARSKSDMLTEAEMCVMLRAAVDPVPAAPVEWDGTGLPPVGTACEWRAGNQNGWEPVTVIAWGCNDGSDSAIFQRARGGWSGCAWPEAFRPILTPEQRAAKERDEAVAAMLDSSGLSAYDNVTVQQVCEALHLAGWRKTEGEA